MRLAHHELAPSRKSGVQFAADAMATGRIKFLTDTNAQGHPSGGETLLKAFGLSGDVMANLGVKGEGIPADMQGGGKISYGTHL